IAACPVTVGTSVSCVHVIVCTNGALSLPQSSTYIHVRVCVLVQLVVLTVPSTGYPALSAGDAVQLSAAVGATKAGAAVHPVAVIAACPVTVGTSVSCVQVMVCTNGALSLPQSSTNIHVRVCVLVQLVVL